MRKGSVISLVVAELLLFTVACGGNDNNKSEVSEATNAGGSGTTTIDNAGQGGQLPAVGGNSGAGETTADAGSVKADAGGGAAGANGSTNAGASGVAADAGEVAADAGEVAADAVGGTSDTSSGDDFDTCYVALTKEVDFSTLDTEDKISHLSGSSIKFIPIPLADGSTYGPLTIQGGPYGAAVDWNAGEGTEFATEVNIAEATCAIVQATFGEPVSVMEMLQADRGMDYSAYTIYRPACFKKGEKYPVITWANGTCGWSVGYGALLASVASHGFVVFQSNSSWTGTPPTDTVQTRALDFAEALNEDPNSVYYQKLDMDKIGAMGHSQGASATGNASSDPRIKALIFWNAGDSNNKPYLNVSGDNDIMGQTPAGMTSAVNSSTQPGAWLYFHQILNTRGMVTGHLTLMEQPDRVWELCVNWWNYILKGDAEAKKMFVGDSCGLCNRADEFEYGHNSLLQ